MGQFGFGFERFYRDPSSGAEWEQSPREPYGRIPCLRWRCVDRSIGEEIFLKRYLDEDAVLLVVG